MSGLDLQFKRELTSFCGQRQVGRNLSTVFRIDCPSARCGSFFFGDIPRAAKAKYKYRLRPCWNTKPCPGCPCPRNGRNGRNCRNQPVCVSTSPCCRRYF